MASQPPFDPSSSQDEAINLSAMNGEEANGPDHGRNYSDSAASIPSPSSHDGGSPPRHASVVKTERRNDYVNADHSNISSSAEDYQKERRSSSASSSSYHSATESQSISDSASTVSPFLQLPPELIDAILYYLSPYDLAALSSACRNLRRHALSDVHWQSHVQDNVPGVELTSPGPCASYRELYAAHDRLWFLPKYKLWFCDRDLMGKIIVVRYDPRRGCIEGYQLLAERGGMWHQFWEANSHVIIHGFEPRVKLHLDKPVLQFRVQKSEAEHLFVSRPGANRFADEMPMELDDRLDAVFSNFLFARALDPEVATAKLASGYPYGRVWPPLVIPARHHVSGVNSVLDLPVLDLEDRPQHRAEVSDQAFRIRQWMEMAGSPAAPHLVRGRIGDFTPAAAVMPILAGIHPMAAMSSASLSGIHIGEEIITYSTLDPVLYTPTALKPWRGIWVGDYSSHGCEFLLVNQPDDPPATDEELYLVRGETESDEQWEKRRTDAHLYRGRLEAIKLTGDPNVPRGEYTFIADDLGPDGHVADAVHSPFTGARVVRSRGHVANTGFIDDNFMECELILISKDRLAQYWVGFGHISYFQRVDIDSFLTP